MKKLVIVISVLLAVISANSQHDILLKGETGTADADLQTVLYFEGINLEKFILAGSELKGKNYQINIKEFKEGKLTKADSVFNSKEAPMFLIQEESLKFAVTTKVNDIGEFKIRLQFDGFAIDRKYQLAETQRELFSLKDFFGEERQISVVVNKKFYLLAFMMPYIRKDGSTTYCDVAQSGIDPERLYEKYKIPHYFLIEMMVEK